MSEIDKALWGQKSGRLFERQGIFRSGGLRQLQKRSEDFECAGRFCPRIN
jgi:hypothetical protein